MESANDAKRSVSVNPGRILLMVIQGGNSLLNVLDHEAIAPLKVFDNPIFGIGSLTEVEMILTMRPKPEEVMLGRHRCTSKCDACKCLLNGASKS